MASLTPEQRAKVEAFDRTLAKDFANALNQNAKYGHEQQMKRLEQNPETPPEA